MSQSRFYPPADRSTQWYGDGNAIVTPLAILWHTTETAGGWPSYSGGSMAPNLTYEPWQHTWRQHFRLDGTSRALANGPNYQTNRMGVCQVEISCISDPRSSGYSSRGIRALDDQAFTDLGGFAGFMASEWGIPLVLTDYPFQPVPQSGGADNRFTPSAFPPFAGHCGHQHAPYNDHGDPGDLDVARIIGSSGEDWFDMATAQDLNDVVINVFRSPEAQQIIRDQVDDVLRSQFNHPGGDQPDGECFGRVVQASNISAQQMGDRQLMVAIVTRAQWGAAFRVDTAGRHVAPGQRRFTVVHWPGGNVSGDEAAIVRSIERQHRGQGWNAAPGYNYLVGQSGTIFEGCGRDVRGAHSPPRNVDGWGICVLAPMNAPATPAALTATRALRDWLCQVAGRQLTMSWHAEHHPTGCPGAQLTAWVRAGMPADRQITPPSQGSWLDMASQAEVQQAVNDGVIGVLRGGEAQQIIRDQVNDVVRSLFNHPGQGRPNGEVFDRVIQACNTSLVQTGVAPSGAE